MVDSPGIEPGLVAFQAAALPTELRVHVNAQYGRVYEREGVIYFMKRASRPSTERARA